MSIVRSSEVGKDRTAVVVNTLTGVSGSIYPFHRGYLAIQEDSSAKEIRGVGWVRSEHPCLALISRVQQLGVGHSCCIIAISLVISVSVEMFHLKTLFLRE